MAFSLFHTLQLRWLLALLGLLLAAPLRAQSPLTPAQYQQDFAYFWTTVRDNYAYFDKKQTDWEQVRQLYAAQLPGVSSRAQFVRLLENALNELYDPHASLSTNLPDSRRLIPSGTDVWAEFRAGKARVVAVRAGFGAARAGLEPGAEILAINGQPVAEALRPWLPRTLRAPDQAATDVALNLALAGDHRTPRQLTVRTPAGHRAHLRPDLPTAQLEHIRYPALLESRQLGTVGYIRINNSLGDNRLIAAFDSALDALSTTTALVLDLRETPSGGNSTVARALMGRLITQEQEYQRHELVAEERTFGIRRSWVEVVSPRARPYTRPVVVLVGRWTGSMAEGITIGLDAMHRATSLGTEMARLRGAVTYFRLPNSSFGFTIPTERLYQPTGQPREEFVPTRRLDLTRPSTADAGLEQALELLNAPAKP